MTKTTTKNQHESNLIPQYPPRRRVRLTCPETSITEPDEQRFFSMSSIKKRLDQGIMPPMSNDGFYSLEPLKYSNLQDALEFHQNVTREFESLPAGLRKLMGNNIHNFESFIHDPKNKSILEEYGLLKPKPDASNSEIVENLKDLNNHFKSTSKTSPDNQK